MKVSKIPGLGRFGNFVDGVDFDHITDEEWAEIGQLHLNGLVTIIRDTNLTPQKYSDLINQWGQPRQIQEYALSKKYHATPGEIFKRHLENDPTLSKEDHQWAKTMLDIVARDDQGRPLRMLKVTGKRKEDGSPLGMFAEGELLWHSNESGCLTFTPGVSLLAWEGVVGSATGFVTTVDWYERQSESFRSELDEMILIHRFSPGKINPGLREDQDFIMYRNMCPKENTMPMVIQSPGGLKGLHYSVNTVSQVQGMSMEESQKLFERINRELFTEEFMYDHWYKQNGDLCLFDNSITLHRRLGGIANRLAYRIQYDYTYLQDGPYNPYFQNHYQREYIREIRDQIKTLGLDFKVPKASFVESLKGLFA
jgi:alpha-ketoglutarate-dependent taurine dioxygenase